jgi:hypothetical protein
MTNEETGTCTFCEKVYPVSQLWMSGGGCFTCPECQKTESEEPPKPKREMSNHAKTAKVIRAELKQAFPTTAFRVNSESFSGGSSVNIHWTDGPTDEQVEKITGKYQYGHFDGMIDLYEISNKRDDIPQVRFVMEERSMSDQTRDQIVKNHNATYCKEGQITNLEAWNENSNCWNREVIYRVFKKLDLSQGVSVGLALLMEAKA